MIHILLLILKIIGIILLTAFVLALLILFYPVTYKAKVNVKDKKYTCDTMAGWLFHIVHFRGIYKDEEFYYALRILGIPIFSSRKNKSENKKSNHKKRHNNNDSVYDSNKNSKETMNDSINNCNKYYDENNDSFVKDCDKCNNTENDDLVNDFDVNSEVYEFKGIRKFVEQVSRFFKKIVENTKKLIVNIKKLIVKIKLFFSDTRRNMNKLVKKSKEIKSFIVSDTTKEAYNYAKRIIIKLLRHIKPKRIKAKVRFGFSEPHITGQALGYVAMAMSALNINPKYVDVNPDFENQVLDGEINASGYVLLGVVGIYILKLYLKKEINDVIKKFS